MFACNIRNDAFIPIPSYTPRCFLNIYTHTHKTTYALILSINSNRTKDKEMSFKLIKTCGFLAYPHAPGVCACAGVCAICVHCKEISLIRNLAAFEFRRNRRLTFSHAQQYIISMEQRRLPMDKDNKRLLICLFEVLQRSRSALVLASTYIKLIYNTYISVRRASHDKIIIQIEIPIGHAPPRRMT